MIEYGLNYIKSDKASNYLEFNPPIHRLSICSFIKEESNKLKLLILILIQSYPNNNTFLNAFNQTLYYTNRRFYKSYWKIIKYFNLSTERIINNGIIFMDNIFITICESRKAKLN